MGPGFYVRHSHFTVDQQREVALDGLCLGQRCVERVALFGCRCDGIPVELSEEDGSLEVGVAAQRLRHNAQASKLTTFGGADDESLREDRAFGAFSNSEHSIGYAGTAQDACDSGFEIVERGFLGRTQPVALARGACNPESEARFFRVWRQRCFGGAFFFGIEEIDIPELIEGTVGIPAVGVVRYCLKSAEEKCLAQYVEVLAQRVEKLDTMVGGIFGKTFEVAFRGEGIIEYFHPPRSGELFGDSAPQIVGSVDGCLVGKTGMKLGLHRNLIVAVDAEEVFDDVAGTAYIDAICRDGEAETAVGDVFYSYFKGREDAVDGVMAEFISDECVEIAVFHFDGIRSYRLRIVVERLSYGLAAGELADKHGSKGEGFHTAVGVDAALEAERRVGADAVAACRTAHGCGVETCAFEKYGRRRILDAGVESAENAGYAAFFFSVAYHQIGAVESMLNLV